ncbi:MAG: M14 family zinc carboxypeptidase [Ignavibacteria bacterium]|nr:M14 family zinc carboxypeptidase [Ignavibacteria bacterium]
MYKVLMFVIILTAGSIGQSYKQVKIYLNNKEDIRTLQSFNISVDHSYQTRDNAILTFLNDAEFNQLTMLNFRYEVLIDDWKSYYEKRERMNAFQKSSAIEKSKNQFGVTNFGFGSMGGYYTYDEVVQKLDTMKLLYPNLITAKSEIGKTIEERSVYYVKISDNPDVDEDEPEVLYTALIHAREPESMMQMLYFMYYLLENYGTDPEATYLVNNRELYFIPIINPDGYVYNQTQNPNGGGMWRKNRRNNGASYGVDLNRNFGPSYYWNAPNGGSSLNSADETYRGVSPFSEPETENIANFVLGRKIKNALNYHTYSNQLIYPYGALERETPDSLIFREFAGDMTELNHYTTGTDLSTVGYSTRGNSDDFMYDGDTSLIGKILAMTPEVGNETDGFWPSENRIFPLAEENLFPNLYYAWVAGGYVSLASYSFDREIVMPGDTVHLTAVQKNKGLSEAANVKFSLTADPLKVVVLSEPSTKANLKSRESFSIEPVFVLNPTLKNGENVQIVLSTMLDNIPMAEDTVSFTVGVANIVFRDSSLSPSTKWNITSNVTQKWDVTPSSYNSIPNSFTDSPKGNYESNATVVMTLRDSITLLGISNPKLTFWTKFDLENDWDCGKVEISSDLGKTWIPVGGKYANTAEGQGRQFPTNSLLYDGAQKDWVKEEIDLKTFTGKQIKIRFSLLSDGYVQKDGWYLDDISIVTYDDLTSVDGKELNAPFNFSLSQNYPNPFNPGTMINYQTASAGFVSLKIFDVLGNEVETLVNEVQEAGSHTVQFSSAKSRLASGVYFYRLKTEGFTETKKMVLLR